MDIISTHNLQHMLSNNFLFGRSLQTFYSKECPAPVHLYFFIRFGGVVGGLGFLF